MKDVKNQGSGYIEITYSVLDKVLISLYTYQLNLKCMLVELLRTGVTDYTNEH